MADQANFPVRSRLIPIATAISPIAFVPDEQNMRQVFNRLHVYFNPLRRKCDSVQIA